MVAAVLAGGENRRLPFKKGFLELGGKTIIESTLQCLDGLFDQVFISTNEPEHYFRFGVPMVGDVIDERGPMTGIYSAITAARGHCVFVVACDMPFIKPEIVEYLISRKGSGEGATVPVVGGRPEPLCAVYSRALAPEMYRCIREGRKGLTDFLKKIDVLYVGEDELKALDPDGRSFMNINTLNDLEDALKPEVCELNK